MSLVLSDGRVLIYGISRVAYCWLSLGVQWAFFGWISTAYSGRKGGFWGLGIPLSANMAYYNLLLSVH